MYSQGRLSLQLGLTSLCIHYSLNEILGTLRRSQITTRMHDPVQANDTNTMPAVAHFQPVQDERRMHEQRSRRACAPARRC